MLHAETRSFLREHGEVFGFEGVKFVTTREESLGLNELLGPAVIIAAAGMAEAGGIGLADALMADLIALQEAVQTRSTYSMGQNK